MPGLLIWAVPRSRITALERAFMQRPDAVVRHEDLTVPTLATRGGENFAQVWHGMDVRDYVSRDMSPPDKNNTTFINISSSVCFLGLLVRD